MRQRRYCLFNLIAAVTAVSTGLITLVALFVDTGILAAIAALVIQISVVVLAISLIVGFLNLMLVHLRRIRGIRTGGLHSLVLTSTAVVIILLHALDVRTSDDLKKPLSPIIFDAILVPLESALAGLLFFFLVFAAYRMLRHQMTWNSFLFLGSLLLIVAGWLPLKELDALKDMRDWALEYPVSAGSRGILIGTGLATVAAGLRVLIGQDRVYREE